MVGDGRVCLICEDWMVDYISHTVWQKFETNVDIDQGFIDLTNGIIGLQNSRSSEKVRNKEVLFLMLTYQIMVMRKGLDDENAVGPQESDFEDIARMVKDLDSFCNDEVVMEEAAAAHMETCVQKFLVCCRQNRYDEARQYFEEKVDIFDKETHRRLQSILHRKKKFDQYMASNKLKDYVALMSKFIKTVRGTFPEKPIMWKLAESYTKNGSRYKGFRSQSFHREVSDAVGDIELDEEEEEALDTKLKAFRKRKLELAASSIEDTNSEKEDDAMDGAPDSVIRSPRKKSRSSSNTISGKSPHKQSRKSMSPDKISSINSSDGEEMEEETEDSHNQSLGKRVPFQKKAFRMRKSLGPPKKISYKNPSIRRKWTTREEEDFYQAIQSHGVGAWQSIRDDLQTDRSNVHLKDKWRTILKTSYNSLCKKFGPV